MRFNVGRITVAILLVLSSLATISFAPDTRAEPVEHTYFLHAESTSGIGTNLDASTTPPEPNPTTISINVSAPGPLPVGDGWIQVDNFDHERNMSGVWTFTMHVYCDDNIINGQLYAQVFDGLRNQLNAENKSAMIGPCDDPNSPKEIIWDDVIDDPWPGKFLDGERFRVEIWFDAISGGTTPTISTPSAEVSIQGQTVSGTYLETQANNEGGTQYEQLREVISPCGISTKFDVIAEIIVEGKSISGDYTSLHANDDVFEDIGEDNNPNSLNWTWAIDISSGSGQYSLYLDAVIDTAPLNDDNFTVSYSTTGAFLGEEVTVFTINKSWLGSPSDPPPARYDFPAGTLTGVPTVYIRIVDTNEVDWPQVKDVLKLDRMYIELVESTTNCSVMEHLWTIDNFPAAIGHRLFVSGYHSPSSDGDDYRFFYSAVSSLGPFEEAFTLTNTSDEDHYLVANVLGPPGSTTLWVKAEDTDRTGSASPSLDDLFVDHIYLSTPAGGTPYRLHLIVDNATYPSKIKTVEDAGVDTMKPTSTVQTLPLYSDPVFDVEFVASDIGSGVHHVELWYILPDDIHIQYPGFFTTSPISFTAPGDGKYYFYTRAVDNALNYEDRPPTFDAMTIVDTTPPSVTQVKPGNNQKDVDLSSKIVIRFSETMNSSSVNQAFVLIEGDNVRLWNAGDGIVVWNHPGNNSFTFSLTNGEAFRYGTEYKIMLDSSASDLAGNSLVSDVQSTFQTESEFNPATLLFIMILAVSIMILLLLYFMFFKKRPSEEDKEPIREAVQAPPTSPQYPGPAYQPPATYVPPPVTMAPPPYGAQERPTWESEKPVEEMWKEDKAAVSACNLCGRFIPSDAQYCPHCGSRTTAKRSSQ